MRIWSLHPRYLDPQGLVALWREALLAQAVLAGRTRGYRNHPQIERFRVLPDPCSVVGGYLQGVHAEAVVRGYAFDRSKFVCEQTPAPLTVTEGQLAHEWQHLMRKLAARNPALHDRWRLVGSPECHPLFRVRPGPIESWERVDGNR